VAGLSAALTTRDDFRIGSAGDQNRLYSLIRVNEGSIIPSIPPFLN
jgi:hypothetical protein